MKKKIELKERRRMSQAEWLQEGARLFGKDPMQWKFKCVVCGHVQTGQDFAGIDRIDPMNTVYFSCLGRWKKDVGCDWTLGGLFQIHVLEVVTEDGKAMPCFEFAADEKV